jgi:hypothetical protein
MGDIRTSAAELSTEVNSVLAKTGASKVDLVGWSLGLATGLLSIGCEACDQQLQGSSFLTSLNQAPTVPGVK